MLFEEGAGVPGLGFGALVGEPGGAPGEPLGSPFGAAPATPGFDALLTTAVHPEVANTHDMAKLALANGVKIPSAVDLIIRAEVT